jgi:hypothetical protein
MVTKISEERRYNQEAHNQYLHRLKNLKYLTVRMFLEKLLRRIFVSKSEEVAQI